MIRETRVIIGGNLRAAGSNSEMRVAGLAARYGVPTVIADGKRPFREIIQRGAFRKAVAEKQDVRLFVNHDPNRILGRTASGTLQLRDTEDGLVFSAVLPDTQIGRDVYELVKRGDMNSCSFGFGEVDDTWGTETVAGRTVASRTIRNVKRLADVSIVTEPAYPGTSVSARSLENRSVQIPDFVVNQLDEDIEAILRRRRLLDIVTL